MSTPEGKVKAEVKAVLEKFGLVLAARAGTQTADSLGWYYMPADRFTKGIPDFIGHYLGWFFSIETKAEGKKPNGFQELQITTIRDTHGKVFVIDTDPIGIDRLKAWLNAIREQCGLSTII